MGLIGSSFSFLIRLELGQPGSQVLAKGQLYNGIVTAHGLIMIFFFVMPILIGGFGKWFIPVYMNRGDMAFPRLKNLRFWLLLPSIILLMMSFFSNTGVGSG
jgi:cytochrome c oxidase subunit 1